MRLCDFASEAQRAIGPNYVAHVVPVVIECAQVTIRKVKGVAGGVRYPAGQLRDAIKAMGLRIVFERLDETKKEWFCAIDGAPFKEHGK